MPIRKFEKKDRELILDYIIKTEVFNSEEVSIASELIDVFLNDNDQKDYELFTFADEEDVAQGYVCIGLTPATIGTYDLYWIVVNPNKHNSGIGKNLMNFVDENLKSQNGNLIIAETSSTEKYINTRKFYEKCGYEKLSQIKDYYRTNDDLVVYGKYLKKN